MTIHVTSQPTHVLLVPPCHSQQGVKLTIKGTHPGLKRLQEALLENTTHACLVYELDGTPLQTLHKLTNCTAFDIIGFSFLATTFKFDLEVLAALFQWSPKSVYLLGGSKIVNVNHKMLFDALPIDIIFVSSSPSLFTQLIQELVANGLGIVGKETVLSRLPELDGVILRPEYVLSGKD